MLATHNHCKSVEFRFDGYTYIDHIEVDLNDDGSGVAYIRNAHILSGGAILCEFESLFQLCTFCLNICEQDANQHTTFTLYDVSDYMGLMFGDLTPLYMWRR